MGHRSLSSRPDLAVTRETVMLERQLKRWIRRGRILTAPAQLAGYDADGLGYKTFRPDAVVIPADREEMIELFRHATELDVPITVRGAGTSLSGGPVAAQGGVVVHTSALRKIREIHRDGFWCEVESSVVLNQLDAALQPFGMFYPPDPSSGPVCTLGGNVAMNAGGAHCFRYGVTSNYVLGVEAVLLDGSVHRFGGPAGGRGPWLEDWKRLMVGSEGTLGAFTRFWLRLLPRPEKAWTFRATYGDLRSAERAIHQLVVDSSFPVAIELMDPRCVAMVEHSPMAVGLPKDAFLIVTEIEGPAALVDTRVTAVRQLLDDAGAIAVESSDDPLQRQKLWKARKVAGGLMGQISTDFLVQDAVIPKRALADILQLVYDEADAAGLPSVNVFHAGDGNLHPNFLFDSRKPGELEKVEAISKRLMQRVVEVGGTLSGEHGIGNDKTAYMPMIFSDETLRLQLAVPAAFNPQHQLNPLKVFAHRSFVPHADPNTQISPQANAHQQERQRRESNSQSLTHDPERIQQAGRANEGPAQTTGHLQRPLAASVESPSTQQAELPPTHPDVRQNHPSEVINATDASSRSESHAQPKQPSLSVFQAKNGSRVGPCFEPFLDTLDGVICLSAAATGAEIEAQVCEHRLRFPLLISPHATLPEQWSATEYAPASSRFGPLCDNILGMNWRLPSGRVVRVGERVVKSTTGYDLLRFLLHAADDGQHVWGEPVDLVLRLRPDCGRHGTFWLTGSYESTARAARELLPTSWMNWFDAIDLLVVGGTTSARLRIQLNAPSAEWSRYETMLQSFAQSQQLDWHTEQEESPYLDALPDVMLKTTPDRAPALAAELAERHGLACRVLCYNGVILGSFVHQVRHNAASLPTVDRMLERTSERDSPMGESRVGSTPVPDLASGKPVDLQVELQQIIRAVQPELDAVGGDWRSRHLPRQVVNQVESAWRERLLQEFRAL
jgi:glycolate oxidase subunit GlcD